MAKITKCSLIKCDPSIKALIMKIDSEQRKVNNHIIVEELDETNLLVKPEKIGLIKSELDRILAKNTYNSIEEEEESLSKMR